MENLGTHFGFAAIAGLALRALAASPLFASWLTKARPGLLNAISIVVAMLSALAIEVSFEGSFEQGGTLAIAWPGLWTFIDHAGGVISQVFFQQQALWSNSLMGRNTRTHAE